MQNLNPCVYLEAGFCSIRPVKKRTFEAKKMGVKIVFLTKNHKFLIFSKKFKDATFRLSNHFWDEMQQKVEIKRMKKTKYPPVTVAISGYFDEFVSWRKDARRKLKTKFITLIKR